MIVLEAFEFVKNYISMLDDTMRKLNPDNYLTKKQKFWLSLCLSCMYVTKSLNWTQFERVTLGGVKKSCLSWMFRKGNILWETLLESSLKTILKEYDIKKGELIIDDTENWRSKNTTTIPMVSKTIDKTSGGFKNGQQLIFLLLVTDKITIPVGFEFYQPDPEYTAWKKKDKKLKEQGIKKSDRPNKPVKNIEYPTKQELATQLIETFKKENPKIKINFISADALYGNKTFFLRTKKIYPKVQLISQLRSNQKIIISGKEYDISKYFKNKKGISTEISIRHGKKQIIHIVGIRAIVKAHNKKRFIIALKYDGETDYRYIVASNLCWRMKDIVTAYSLRWLVEVFIQDWKAYNGWCAMAKQQGEEGSSRGVILSLLIDHCTLLHPEQKALIDNNLPAATAGSIHRKAQFNAFISYVEHVLTTENPAQYLEETKKQINNLIVLEESKKHLSGRKVQDFKPSPHLEKRFAA